jgi:predicted permease
MNALIQDLKFGLRMLAKNPGFTTVAVITLALGIGANTAIFSIVNAILLRPLPAIPRIDGLVQLGRSTFTNGVWVDFDTVSYPNYEDYRDHSHVFDGLTAFAHIPLDLGGEEAAERIKGAVATTNYFQVLGLKAALGRTFMPGLGQAAETQPIAVLSYHLWQRRYGGDPSLIGKVIRINSHPFVVAGIAPRDFRGTQLDDPADLWVPMTVADQVTPAFVRGWNNHRGACWLQVVGRLKPGVTPQHAQAEMQSIARQLELAYPTDNKDIGVAIDTHLGMWPGDRAEAKGFAALLMVIVGLVVLIACANVAGLLLARSNGRRKEIAVRMALGAGRSRVICQLLMESVLLALAAGLLALLIGFWTSDLLSVSWLSTILPRADFTPDVRVFGFTLLVAFITSLVFGLIPALQTSQGDLISDLKESGGALVRERLYLRNGLVIGQIAICLVLLVAAGLTVRTLQVLERTNPGVEVRNILEVSLDAGPEGYNETGGRLFYRQLLDRVQSLPGVASACLTLTAPVNPRQWGTRISIDDGLNPAEQAGIPVNYTSVTPDYFSTLGISLVAGRGFSDRDGAGEKGVVVINQTMARRLWPGENPIGRRLRLEQQGEDLEIVGVASDVKIRDLSETSRVYMYLPFTQRYESRAVLLVRARTNPLALLPSVERETHFLDGNIPLIEPRTLTEHVEESLGRQRLMASLIAIFGLLALALAAVGLYGTISYAVSQRTRELGIRMALGAERRDVLRLVVRHGLKLTLIGLGIGIAGALALTRFLSTLLYGVRPTDPLTFVAVSLLLAVVALFACYIPARRATKVDPMVALRYE